MKEINILTNYGEATFEVDENGKITHRSLLKYVDVINRGFFKTFVDCTVDEGEGFVKCAVTDNSGYRVEVLEGFDKCSDVSGAHERAFDEAMRRMLCLDSLVVEDAATKPAPQPEKKTSRKTESKAKPEPKPEVKSEPKPETKPEPKSETKPEIQPETSVDPIESDEDDGVIDVIEADDADEVEEDEVEETPEEPTGAFVLDRGSKKGQTLRQVYETTGGKGWLDYCLGGSLTKLETKKAIVAFYVANNIPGPDGSYKEDATKQQKEIAINGKKVFEELKAELK